MQHAYNARRLRDNVFHVYYSCSIREILLYLEVVINLNQPVR